MLQIRTVVVVVAVQMQHALPPLCEFVRKGRFTHLTRSHEQNDFLFLEIISNAFAYSSFYHSRKSLYLNRFFHPAKIRSNCQFPKLYMNLAITIPKFTINLAITISKFTMKLGNWRASEGN